MDQEPLDNEQFDDIPPINPALIVALKKRLPERWPNPEMPDRSIWVRAGQLKLIEFLEYVMQRQRAEAAENTLNVHR